ncbi:MAG: TonB-dependent hemoglobin/transferrin/lactoferrin family receptor [Deltaproteobacteria bacterium]|nr:TonB-dependent hemoglobin/transferrin/lactoferrin family receptor [Deltaproteobacteria bacterium]
MLEKPLARRLPGIRNCLWVSSFALFLFLPSFALLAGDSSDPDAGPRTDNSAVQATFLDDLTVTATLSERTLEDTPGSIDVIGAAEIAELGYTGIADLVRFTPGVYVEGDLSRLGTSGFNIRGIGGNRVLTQIDGIPTAEQFDFGPFSVTQYSIDLDTLESAEIVRSAGSALYGSDALGGVVSLVTRSPRSYLGGEAQYFSLRGGYDSRATETSESLVYARGNDIWQGSIVFTHRDGAELDNQGDIATEDFTRTEPNPIDRRQDNALLKIGRTGASSQLDVSLEWFDGKTETEVLSGRNPGSPFGSAVRDFDALDTQERQRLSVEQSLVPQNPVADSLIWRAFWQQADTEQDTDEIREGSLGLSDRDGLLAFDQETLGLEVEARKGLGSSGKQSLTYGIALQQDTFDQLRDRSEVVIGSGAPVPTSLVFPTKYFPESEVQEIGAFIQTELELWNGRLRLIPGVRYDSYDLDANQGDAVFLNGNPGTPEPADITDDAISPKLGAVLSLSNELSFFAQYARGFRAPPMSAVNNGFTNQGGGYRTLANPELEPETSDNLEIGLRGNFSRGSFSIVGFENRFDDFIETVFLGFDPREGLVEFQPQNINEVEISGLEIAADLRLGQSWRWRAAYSLIDGDNVTAEEPLESIAPPTLVTGLRFSRPDSLWGLQGTATLVSSKSASDLPTDSTQFRPPSSETFDLAAWITLSPRITLQATAWNLTDETFWQWTYVRGRDATSSTLDRYTNPGRSFGLQARFTF